MQCRQVIARSTNASLYWLSAIGNADEPKASSSTFSSFGCVFLPLQVIAAAPALFDFVSLFSH
jgi:hypothetical protein